MVHLTRTQIEWIKQALHHDIDKAKEMNHPLTLHHASNLDSLLQQLNDIKPTDCRIAIY